MLDIGSIHRREYELEDDRAIPVVIAEAPGRLHYLGEHGEPKAGLFLSSAIDRYIQVAVSFRKDSSLRFYAADFGERKRTTLVNLKYKREDRWANHIKAAVDVFSGLGCPVRGLNFTVMGTIPQNTGLASSQAMEVASVMALKGLFQVSIKERELVKRLAMHHESFFDAEAAPIDYHIILTAKKDNFILADESALQVKRIKSPLSKYCLLLMDSRVPRVEIGSELLRRQADIKKGLELLSKKKQAESFRDFAAMDLIESMGDLPEVIRRRSMHVVQEIRRVADAEAALTHGDLPSFTKTIAHSHESLRDLYEVSCPEVDWLVKRAQELEGVLASRMTGQGFGGCTYTFIQSSMLDEYKKRLEEYERIFGFRPLIYTMKLGSGAKIVEGIPRTVGGAEKKIPLTKAMRQKP